MAKGLLKRLKEWFSDLFSKELLKHQSKGLLKHQSLEEDLRVSEEKYSLLFETMAQGVIYLDANGKVLSANPAAESLLGFSTDQMQGKTVLDPKWKAIREDGSELPQSEHSFMRALKTGKPVGPTIEGVFQTQRNDYIWLSVYAIPLFRQGETNPYQVFATFRDITAERKANQAYQQLFNEMVDAFALHEIICDDNGKPVNYRFLKVNPAFERMTGIKSADINGKTVMELLPDIEKHWIDNYGKVALTGESIRFEDYNISSDKHFMVSAYQPTPNQFACTFSDITERIRAEEEKEKILSRYISYIESAPYGIFVLDANGKFIEVNSFASSQTGYSKEQLIQMSVTDMTAEESLEAAVSFFQKLKSSGYVSEDLKYIHKSGEIRWRTIDAVKLSEDRYLCFQIDITEKKDAESKLHYLINHDYLTGVYNRRFFEEEIERIDNEKQLPITIMIGDINGVKLANDAFSHSEGDRLIIDSAKIISGCLRKEDTVARIGGDEFGIIMPRTDNEAAMGILQKIQAELAAFDSRAARGKLTPSISLGFACKESADEDIHQIIRNAEEYMYQHKLLELNSSHSTIVSSIKATMNENSHETAEHAERLVALTRLIADMLDLLEVEKDRLELLATLHDIGKVGISENILRKPGKLSKDEWIEMKRHPEIGYRIAIATPELIPIAEGILCHHEYWDGNGYPQGLNGENIPLPSRILSVADAYDAMTQDRPYRKAMTHEEAIIEIKRCAGTQFDPNIVQILLDAFR